MSLTSDRIVHAARLARIALAPGEAEAVRVPLGRVLELIDQMGAVDTAGIEPMAHALDARLDLAQRLRSDTVSEPDLHALFQSGAPAVEDGLYLVPKVIE